MSYTMECWWLFGQGLATQGLRSAKMVRELPLSVEDVTKTTSPGRVEVCTSSLLYCMPHSELLDREPIVCELDQEAVTATTTTMKGTTKKQHSYYAVPVLSTSGKATGPKLLVHATTCHLIKSFCNQIIFETSPWFCRGNHSLTQDRTDQSHYPGNGN